MKNKIIVTGGLGFIGRNIVKKLNDSGWTNIIISDDLLNVGDKWKCLESLKFQDLIHKDDLLKLDTLWRQTKYVIHNGANSSTTGGDCLKTNYEYSKDVMANCVVYGVEKLIYASSGSVYGACETNIEDSQYEKPLNLYAYSKKLFDDIIRRGYKQKQFKFPVVGLRYFNVYGPSGS